MRRAVDLERKNNGRFAAGNSLTLLPHSHQVSAIADSPLQRRGCVRHDSTHQGKDEESPGRRNVRGSLFYSTALPSKDVTTKRSGRRPCWRRPCDARFHAW